MRILNSGALQQV